MQFSRESDEEVGISLTSLIDVIFLLLIFFMVATTLVDPTKRLDIQLPEAKVASPETKSPVTIEMSDRGEITLNGQSVEISSLEARLKTLGQEGKKAAIVRADKRLDYGRVVEVLGICRSVGFQDIGIAVR